MADFSRWAVVSYKDDTGLGRMACDIRRVLGIGRQIVIPSERMDDHPLDPATEAVLRHDDPVERVVRVLEGLDGIVFLERPTWHPRLLETAAGMGVKTVGVPMWEWFRSELPEWRWCDLLVCTSAFSEKMIRACGRENVVSLPWTLDMDRLPGRRVGGAARVFIHNAGLVDHDDRKGTRDTISAFMRVRVPGVRLVVRMQKEAPLPAHDDRVEVRIGNVDDVAGLYATGDCAIQPSKMEGLGFMVIEAVASGLPVVTLDYPPMSEFVRQREMRVTPRWFKRRAFANHWIPQAHLRLPRQGDLVRKIEWCATHDLSEISRENRAWAEAHWNVGRLREQWAGALFADLRRPH